MVRDISKSYASLAQNLLLILVSTLLTLSVCELGVLFVFRHPALVPKLPQNVADHLKDLYNRFDRTIIQVEPAFARYDQDLFYTLKPGDFVFSNREFANAYHVNALGVRDDDEALNTPEVVVAGDSYAMGWGVDQDQRYSDLIRKETGLRVLNTAVASYGTPREMRLLDRVDFSKVRYLIIHYCDNDVEETKSFWENKHKLVVSDEAKYQVTVERYHRTKSYYFGKYSAKIIDLLVKQGVREPLRRLINTARPPDDKVPVSEEARLFLDAVVYGGTHDLTRVHVIVLDNNLDNSFLLAVKKRAAVDDFPEFVKNLQVVDLSKQWRPEHFFALDDHFTASGHRLVADALIKLLRPSAASLSAAGVDSRAEPVNQPISWQELLAPYSTGTPLLDRFRIDAVRRGAENDLIIVVNRPGDTAGVEVHVVPRGRWTGVRESQSFAIGYETLRSPAEAREEITDLLAQAIRSRDHGLPGPDAIPLGTAFEGSMPRQPPWDFERIALQEAAPSMRAIQIAWAVLILTMPLLAWRAGRRIGVGGGRLLLTMAASVAISLVATWHQRDAPLHANGHAWAEAREVLAPWGGRADGPVQFTHGRGGIALQWLLTGVERRLTGTGNPLRISRLAGAAAAAATAFFVATLVHSQWAGLAAGCVLSLMPVAQLLALSGSPLAISEWILPWSLGLLVVAGSFEDGLLLAAAALALALGTFSHTAMLAWPPAAFAVWFVVAPPRFRRSPFALGPMLLVVVAWGIQAATCAGTIVSRSGASGLSLFEAAQSNLLHRNLLLDPQWVSPLLLPMALYGVAASCRREGFRAPIGASALALSCVALPFYAVSACSSDAVRYQGALLGLLTGLAITGAWEIPLAERLGHVGITLLRTALLATLIFLPPASWQPPTDPAAFEHQLVQDAVGRMPPGTLVVLPRLVGGAIQDFPDFLLPEDSSVAFDGDPRIAAHRGSRLIYLGLACISWQSAAEENASEMRPECQTLRDHAHPWFVRSLRREDLPRDRSGTIWTFHRLATGVPFGFFAPD